MARNPIAADDAALRRKTKIGVRMTALYALVYGGFVAVSVFRPSLTGMKALFGLNLAIFYGISLILIAIIFALVYNHLCREAPTKNNKSGRAQ